MTTAPEQTGAHPFVTVDGRRWLTCPVPRCPWRVMEDLGTMALDALDIHLHGHFSQGPCGTCGR